MSRNIGLFTKIAVFIFTSLYSYRVYATPSSVFWTCCTTSVQQEGVLNLGINEFVSVLHKPKQCNMQPPELALNYGLISWGDINTEIGLLYQCGQKSPLMFDARIGINENVLFSHAPSIALGIFDIGTRRHGPHRTNYNILNLNLGFSPPECIGGTLYAGVFSGSRALGKDTQGFMLAVTRYFCPKNDSSGKKYYKWLFAADYASGKNNIGGVGIGIAYYFTPKINLLTGPTWFNDRRINGNWKWSIQLSILFP